jgi:hypothetical protein
MKTQILLRLAVSTSVLLGLCSCASHDLKWHKPGATASETLADHREALVLGSVHSTEARWTPAYGGDGYLEKVPNHQVVDNHMKRLGYKKLPAKAQHVALD